MVCVWEKHTTSFDSHSRCTCWEVVAEEVVMGGWHMLCKLGCQLEVSPRHRRQGFHGHFDMEELTRSMLWES